MMADNKSARDGLVFKICLIIILGVIFTLSGRQVFSTQFAPSPIGPINISQNTNFSLNPLEIISTNTFGGNYSNILLNTSSQTSRWQAFVGNVSGYLGLGDSNNNSIYKWEIISKNGEVLAMRGETIDWSQLQCANNDNITHEESLLGINSTDQDSINNTFSEKNHSAFTVYTKFFDVDECLSIRTKSTNESVSFQEVLLYSSDYLIYTSLIESSLDGFNGRKYDFQLILPTDPAQTNTNYYFYVELV